jgi:prevent-host-death family protein
MTQKRKATSAETTTLTVTEAARSFADIVNRAFYRGERFVLTKGGTPVAELVPLAETRVVTAAQLREALRDMPHLGPDEAASFASDLDELREGVSRLGEGPWDS